MLSLGLMVGLGVGVGFRFHRTAGAALAGLALVLAFGYAVSWAYAVLGLLTRDPETAMVAGILPFFVLMFASSAVVPVATMPGWLQPLARNQPFNVTVDAVRALLQGQPATPDAWQSVAWSAGILAVFFVISVRLYRRTAS